MVQIAVYVAMFAAFVAIYTYLKRHSNWSSGEDGKPYSGRGWWRPLAVGWFIVLVLFVAYASVEHGFRWGMLLVFPVLGGAFALAVLFLKVASQRARDD